MDKYRARGNQPLAGNGGLGVARHRKNPHPGAQGLTFTRRIHAAHVWHNDVAESAARSLPSDCAGIPGLRRPTRNRTPGMDNPSPVPLPFSLVVKNGSNQEGILASLSSGAPGGWVRQVGAALPGGSRWGGLPRKAGGRYTEAKRADCIPTPIITVNRPGACSAGRCWRLPHSY